jgi:hypothetical protein
VKVSSEPCTSHKAHVEYLCPIEGALRTSHGAATHEKQAQTCETALLWLIIDSKRIDCYRFLLEMRRILRDPPQQFVSTYANYWRAYGTVLAKLASRQGSDRDEDVVRRVWREIEDAFTHTDPWDVRADVIEWCFLPLAKQACARASFVGGKDSEPFWAAVNCLTAYFSAACEAPWRQDIAFLKAANYYCELFYYLVGTMKRKRRKEGLHEELQAQLARLAESVLLLLVWQKTLPEALRDWRDAVATYCTFLEPSSEKRASRVRGILEKVANELGMHSELEQRAEFRDAYDKVLRVVVPLLRGYPQAGSRKRIPSGSQRCSLTLKGLDTEIVVEGFLIDVCDTRYGGFCVETKEVLLVGDLQDGGEYTAERVDGEFPCREVEVCRAGDEVANSFKVREAIPEMEYDASGGNATLVLNCKILRAWSLRKRGGTGFGILAPEDATKELDAGWKEFVDNLPYAGRYQP